MLLCIQVDCWIKNFQGGIFMTKNFYFLLLFVLVLMVVYAGCTGSNYPPISDVADAATEDEAVSDIADTAAEDEAVNDIVDTATEDEAASDIADTATEDETAGDIADNEISDIAIAAIYQQALEAFRWFHISSMPSSNIQYDVDGMPFFRVSHDTIQTKSDLEAYLRTIFTPRMVDNLLNTAPIRYKDINGMLYSLGAEGSANRFIREQAREVIRISESKIIYRIYSESLDGLPWEEDTNVIEITYIDLHLMRPDGLWVFDNFDVANIFTGPATDAGSSDSTFEALGRLIGQHPTLFSLGSCRYSGEIYSVESIPGYGNIWFDRTGTQVDLPSFAVNHSRPSAFYIYDLGAGPPTVLILHIAFEQHGGGWLNFYKYVDGEYRHALTSCEHTGEVIQFDLPMSAQFYTDNTGNIILRYGDDVTGRYGYYKIHFVENMVYLNPIVRFDWPYFYNHLSNERIGDLDDYANHYFNQLHLPIRTIFGFLDTWIAPVPRLYALEAEVVSSLRKHRELEALGEIIVHVGTFWEDWWGREGATRFLWEDFGEWEETPPHLRQYEYKRLLPTSGFESIADIQNYLLQFYAAPFVYNLFDTSLPTFIEYNDTLFIRIQRASISRPQWESAVHRLIFLEDNRAVVETMALHTAFAYMFTHLAFDVDRENLCEEVQYYIAVGAITEVRYRFTFVDGVIVDKVRVVDGEFVPWGPMGRA